MNRTEAGALWAIVVVGIGLTVTSGVSAFWEFRPLLESGTTVEEKTAALVARAIRPGPSYRSKILVLNDCNEVLNSFHAATLPQSERQALLDHCRAIARDVVLDSPTYSLAWYIDALAAEGLGDTTARDAGLTKSQMTAPNQGWLALSRAILAERNHETLGAEADAAFDHDIALLINSERGVEWAAQRYLGDPMLGERIATIVEALPDAQQRRFLSAVRRFSKQ